jgi:hypothetical protein
MAELLLIDPNKLTETTILGGNVDFDKYRFCVLDTQIRVIEPLLGTELYEKIKTDYQAETLTGLYLELFNDYLTPILKFGSVATYLSIASYMVDNGGIFKHAPENKEIVSVSEVSGLVQTYNSHCDLHIIRFEKWIRQNLLPEYKTHQDKVNASKDLRTKFGWKL